MTFTTKSSQQESDQDAENEHLMAHDGRLHDEEKVPMRESSYRNARVWIKFTLPGFIALLASTTFISMLLSGLGLHFSQLLNPGNSSESSLPQPGTRFGSCGSTPTSARLANCAFDIMSFSWLPPPCSDPELTAEFSSLRNWTWWLDTDRTSSVPFNEVSRGDYGELFVTREYHMYHCTYMWRKLHRGILKGRDNVEGRGVVDTYIGEYGHTAHCEMMLLGMEGEEGGVVDKNATDTAIVMKFPQCMWM